MLDRGERVEVRKAEQALDAVAERGWDHVLMEKETRRVFHGFLLQKEKQETEDWSMGRLSFAGRTRYDPLYMQWVKTLRSMGFSESEAQVYLSALELGASTVQVLAKKAKVSRVTTYAVIESLTRVGLMSSVEKGKKKLFQAESPERLSSFVHARVKQMEATLREVEASVHELKLVQRGEKPVVKMFEGPEAMKAIQEDVLRSKTPYIDEFGNLDELLKYIPRSTLQSFGDMIRKFSPKMRTFLFAKEQEIKPVTQTVEVFRLPDTMRFSGHVFVYGNRVALSTYKGKQISVIIESIDLVETMRAMFDYMETCHARMK